MLLTRKQKFKGENLSVLVTFKDTWTGAGSAGRHSGGTPDAWYAPGSAPPASTPHIIIIMFIFRENNTTQSLPSNEHNWKAAGEARDSLTGHLCN